MTTLNADDMIRRLRASTDDPTVVIADLVQHFRVGQQPIELFETLKMQTRMKHGLPAVAAPDEGKLSDDLERALEFGLLQACREVGGMMIKQGRVLEGFMYLRPVGDQDLVRRMMSDVEIDEENYDAMIQVLIQEGVDVGRGYAEVLRHQGTCNSITLYEQTIRQFGADDQKAAAICLLDHFYDELIALVRQDVAARDKPVEDHETLGQIIESREWILAEGGYHLDTTHLSSVIKIAAILDDPGHLEKTLDLVKYGRRLNSQFQYPGEEPFHDFYPAYSAYYNALLGQDVAEGLRYFERKARTLDAETAGTSPIDTYVDLLARVGEPARAIREAVDLYPEDVPAQSVLGGLMEILVMVPDADRAVLREVLFEFCLSRNDLLGYAAIAGMSNSG